MGSEADNIQGEVDDVLTRYNTGPIKFYPYVAGATNRYKQRVKTFGAAVNLVGRAILNPTPEKLTVIGNGEVYDIAFLFSRTEIKKKFPAIAEGEWVDVTGELEWFSRRFKVEKVKPTGQVQDTFILVVMLGSSTLGKRDP